MENLRGKVAVITGAASGFGREFAIACAREGMRLVLADVDSAGLEETVERLQWDDADGLTDEVVTTLCDVSKLAEVEKLANLAWDSFGAAHLLFNNAGVACAGPVWSTTEADWDWVLGVNLMGVVHGVRVFVPRMLESGEDCHVVNTASVAGLTSPPGSGVYCVSKHGVVTLSECLHHDLAMLGKKNIGVTVLCPAFVPTGIADAARNRPAELADSNPQAAPFEAVVREAVKKGRVSAAEVAAMTLDAVRENRFYVITHERIKPTIEKRMQEILQGQQPSNPMQR